MLPLCRTSPGRFAESARLGTQLDLPHCSASETNSVATSPPLPGPRTPQSPAHEDLLNTYYSKPGVRKFEENTRSTWIAVHHSTGWPLTCPHSETTGHFESVLPIVKPACSPFFFIFALKQRRAPCSVARTQMPHKVGRAQLGGQSVTSTPARVPVQHTRRPAPCQRTRRSILVLAP